MITLPYMLETKAQIINGRVVITQVVDDKGNTEGITIPVKYWGMFVGDISMDIMSEGCKVPIPSISE